MVLSETDRDVLHRIAASARDVAARTNLAREGDAISDIVLITEGIGCRFKQRTNGARQITAYLVPGDTCDLEITLLNRLDHTIATLSACKVARISSTALQEIIANHPAVARAMRISALIDESTLREWLVNIGCRSALERIAHLFCELLTRLRAVGLATEDSCDLPMTQHELADTTGMTTVHVNRSLQELRRRGLIELRGKNLKILDWARLKSLAEFRPGYLRVGEHSGI
ncbi:Nitrogen fixation regulation protein FixK [Methylobacterium marchantiae]|nr:Nitrogen fixation regulation protein FixK [Methylobacterium marchantiae]